jgi:hypothetical protein
MIQQFLQDAFPLLESEGFRETSPATKDYNCIAWAAGQTTQWWWPEENATYFWPESQPRAATLESFHQAFETLGYLSCTGAELEPGYERIAFFVRDGKPTHAARQLPDGQWTSKLGKYLDIIHTLRGLEGPEYGRVASFMKRLVQAGAE